MGGHSPVFQILLHIVVRMSSMASLTALTNSAGMLSTPVDFPIFSALTAASTSSCDALHLVTVGSQVLLGPTQSHSCKGLSSTLSTC